MPNTYKRTVGKRKYKDFSKEDLERALDDIRSNRITYRQAAEKYEIPISTLFRKIKGRHQSW